MIPAGDTESVSPPNRIRTANPARAARSPRHARCLESHADHAASPVRAAFQPLRPGRFTDARPPAGYYTDVIGGRRQDDHPYHRGEAIPSPNNSNRPFLTEAPRPGFFKKPVDSFSIFRVVDKSLHGWVTGSLGRRPSGRGEGPPSGTSRNEGRLPTDLSTYRPNT